MFWKKKSKGEPESQRIIPPADSRQAYRVAPSEEAPITLFTGGNSYEVLDISSGGLSLTSDDLNVGDDLDVEFNLPMGIELTAERISIRLKVLRRGRNNIYHCRFLDISPEKEDKIHKYVLERQKEELRF
ncbi:MAG: PilZ domain-containing protein [Nitrospina sp.]|nr:PilZ domain-containing protein [Nitrospina sp.]